MNIPDIDEEYPDITVYDLWDPDKIQDEKVRANSGHIQGYKSHN